MLKAQEKLRAIAADAASASLLHVAPGTPLLAVDHRGDPARLEQRRQVEQVGLVRAGHEEHHPATAQERGQPHLDEVPERVGLLQVEVARGRLRAVCAKPEAYAIFRVLERKEVARPDFDKVRATERDTLLEQKKNKFLQSFLAQTRQDMKVKVNYELFTRLNTDMLSRYQGEQ